MDSYEYLSSSDEIFRTLLTNEYCVKEENIEVLVENCKSSLKLQTSSPLYDVVFHKVIRDILECGQFNHYNQNAYNDYI